ETMCQMNLAGAAFAAIDGVKAMTDVTGFGLLGHLSEVCRGAGGNIAFHPRQFWDIGIAQLRL
ncbi:AIR synthase-related protein, partial [Klebsiella variicola]|uniref:AIR synthase-related protein n=1 Tax=Klebsiella variicola TaxID=244366 RepID=UPI001F55224D